MPKVTETAISAPFISSRPTNGYLRGYSKIIDIKSDGKLMKK
jgi:hypothetical protein